MDKLRNAGQGRSEEDEGINHERHVALWQRQNLEGLIATQKASIEEVEREIEGLEQTLIHLQGKLYRYLDRLGEVDCVINDLDEELTGNHVPLGC